MTDPQVDADTELPDPRLEEAVFGAEVEHFLEHDRIGRFLVKRAQEEMDAAKDALVDVDPSDAIKVRDIQNRARVPALVIEWLREAIVGGLSARQQFEVESETEAMSSG